jgi:hypothetical protein
MDENCWESVLEAFEADLTLEESLDLAIAKVYRISRRVFNGRSLSRGSNRDRHLLCDGSMCDSRDARTIPEMIAAIS